MIEDNQTPPEETKESRLSPEAQKKFLFVTAVLILMGAAFVAGRYSVQTKSEPPNPFAQIPTPQPLGTPVPVLESALTMINFTGVSETKKGEVLSAFNTEACSCNCKMTVAACIVKDPNCPFWKDHVTKFQAALGNGKKPDLSKAPKQTMSMPPGNAGGFPVQQGLGK
jgi:hypothetical protein